METEGRFSFHPISDLPPPPEFRNVPKVYRSQQVAEAAPPSFAGGGRAPPPTPGGPPPRYSPLPTQPCVDQRLTPRPLAFSTDPTQARPHQHATRRRLRPRAMPLRHRLPADPRAARRLVLVVARPPPVAAVAVPRAALRRAPAVRRLPAAVVPVARPRDDGVVRPPVRLPVAVRRPCPAAAVLLVARLLAPVAPAPLLPLSPPMAVLLLGTAHHSARRHKNKLTLPDSIHAGPVLRPGPVDRRHPVVVDRPAVLPRGPVRLRRDRAAHRPDRELLLPGLPPAATADRMVRRQLIVAPPPQPPHIGLHDVESDLALTPSL
jgi:hypothetical protein